MALLISLFRSHSELMHFELIPIDLLCLHSLMGLGTHNIDNEMESDSLKFKNGRCDESTREYFRFDTSKAQFFTHLKANTLKSLKIKSNHIIDYKRYLFIPIFFSNTLNAF